MEFSYFDDSVHRWCKEYDAPIQWNKSTLTPGFVCPKLRKAKKGRISKAKYLDKTTYLRKYPE